MICSDCRMGAHWNEQSKQQEKYSRLSSDFRGKAKVMHSLCKDKGCFCQHMLGDMVQRKGK